MEPKGVTAYLFEDGNVAKQDNHWLLEELEAMRSEREAMRMELDMMRQERATLLEKNELMESRVQYLEQQIFKITSTKQCRCTSDGTSKQSDGASKHWDTTSKQCDGTPKQCYGTCKRCDGMSRRCDSASERCGCTFQQSDTASKQCCCRVKCNVKNGCAHDGNNGGMNDKNSRNKTEVDKSCFLETKSNGDAKLASSQPVRGKAIEATAKNLLVSNFSSSGNLRPNKVTDDASSEVVSDRAPQAGLSKTLKVVSEQPTLSADSADVGISGTKRFGRKRNWKGVETPITVPSEVCLRTDNSSLKRPDALSEVKCNKHRRLKQKANIKHKSDIKKQGILLTGRKHPQSDLASTKIQETILTIKSDITAGNNHREICVGDTEDSNADDDNDEPCENVNINLDDSANLSRSDRIGLAEQSQDEIVTKTTWKVNSVDGGAERFACLDCQETFPRVSRLARHMAVHSDGGKPYKCSHCPAEFTASGNLTVHLKRHLGLCPFRCADCDASFPHAAVLRSHAKKHSAHRPYVCKICSAAFSRSRDLSLHNRVHTGEKPFQCEVCGSSFSTSSNLAVHRRTHTGERPFQCDLCGASFSQQGHLKRHRKQHASDQSFRCTACPQAFRNLYYLKVHMQCHKAENVHKCSDCGAAFARASCLKEHRRIHSGQKPYKCTECHMTFARSANLAVHRRKHTGERPYVCPRCSTSFTQSTNLNRHLQSHKACVAQRDQGQGLSTASCAATDDVVPTRTPSSQVEPSVGPDLGTSQKITTTLEINK